MIARWIGRSLKSVVVLKPLLEVVAREGSPALSDKLQRVREEAIDARAQRKARERGAVRQVLDPVLAALGADDWTKVRSLVSTMSDEQLRLLRDAVLESHGEVSARGGPDSGLQLSALIASEVSARQSREDERRRAHKAARPPGRMSKLRVGRRRAPSEVDAPRAASDPALDTFDDSSAPDDRAVLPTPGSHGRSGGAGAPGVDEPADTAVRGGSGAEAVTRPGDGT
jgi:hypothetical protein